MRIPAALFLALFLASCGATVSPCTGSPAVLSATDVQARPQAPGALAWYAERATLPSDAPFAWQWFTAPDLGDFGQRREGQPADLVTMTANLENSAYFEDLVSEMALVLRGLRFYHDEVPCENCHRFDYVLVGQLADGTFGGFRASVFWDH